MNKKSEHHQHYWVEREARKIIRAEQTLAPSLETIRGIYRQNEAYAMEQIRKIYRRGLKAEDLSELELSQNFRDFTRRAKQAGFYDLLPDAYKFRADRLTALNRDIWLNAKQAGLSEYITTSKGYGKAVGTAWRDMAKDHGAGQGFQQIPFETLNKILKVRPNGEDFANAIWRNTDRLAERTSEILLSGIQLGKSHEAMARELSQLTNETVYNSRRIVQTETNYYYNQTKLEQYKALGIDRYRFVAVLDAKTSGVCHAHEGKVFKVEEAHAGLNFPPLHPNCRSGTIAVFEENDTYELSPRMARVDFNSPAYEYDGRHPATFAGANQNTTPTATIEFGKILKKQQQEISLGISALFAEFPQVARTLSEVGTAEAKEMKARGVDGAFGTHGTSPLGIIYDIEPIDKAYDKLTTVWRNEIKLNAYYLKSGSGLNKLKYYEAKKYNVGTSPIVSLNHEFGHAIHFYLSMKKAGLTNTQIDRAMRVLNPNSEFFKTTAIRKDSPSLRTIQKLDKFMRQSHGEPYTHPLAEKTLAKFGLKPQDISEYASTQPAELFAELFAYSKRYPERDISKYFVAEIHKALNK